MHLCVQEIESSGRIPSSLCLIQKAWGRERRSFLCFPFGVSCPVGDAATSPCPQPSLLGPAAHSLPCLSPHAHKYSRSLSSHCPASWPQPRVRATGAWDLEQAGTPASKIALGRPFCLSVSLSLKWARRWALGSAVRGQVQTHPPS